MNINLDDKRLIKIIYQLEDGSVVAYNFKNGELWCTQLLAEDYERYEPTDRELIDKAEKLNLAKYEDRIKNMIRDELEDARKRFKIDKEIVDTFPNKDDRGNPKRPDTRCSDESLEVVKEIIKMDKEGKLDEILKKKYGFTKKDEKPLSDKEMIDAINKSEFMDELNAARKRFKIDKEIVDGFPEKDDTYRECQKRSEDKCSEESLKVAQEIIKMDKEGKLDEILKRHNNESVLDKYVRENVDSPLNDSELSDDSFACQKNMNFIESKIVSRLRREDFDATKDDEFQKLLENYNFYKTKKKEIDDKIWEQIPKAQ
jgi:hypothetical protein